MSKQDLKELGVAVLLVLVAGIVVVAMSWLFSANGLALSKVFSPALEQVRRETFEESKAYRDGQVQELESMRYEYLKTDPAHRDALASIIRHRAAGIPDGMLHGDLAEFVRTPP